MTLPATLWWLTILFGPEGGYGEAVPEVVPARLSL